MDAADIEAILVSQYIDDVSSCFLKLRLDDGDILYGEFLKANQINNNKVRNKWIFSTAEKDLLIDGKYISYIHLYNNRNENNSTIPKNK